MDALTTAPLKWLFERCVFEESTLELSVDGRLVELERKPLEVLRHLLRHAGEVVTKEEIHAAVWPGRVLSDTVLTKAVSRIREALGDDAQTLIKTVHGYGYRLIAPVSVETALAKPSPVLGLKAGDSPPLRAQWKLEAHLGSGGSGEVWKVVHAKTGDVRVYKFAVDAEALNTLKREITLFRLLRQQLGADAPIAEMLDWNLEEAPYFLELTHYHAGNLALWAAAQGGLSQIPLATRLDVFADIAAAVAVIHGVGVLHKDLKASNIFMRGEGLEVKPLLADFGGGGVMAEDVIANAGITRMGFTQLLGPAGQATTLYLAPEVLEGQPQTIRGDIYALGVLLYQMCIGDFRKPVSTGWELGIEDELLQRDIAEAVQGDPERRLSSAQALADRIRTLDARRAALSEQRRIETEQRAAVIAAEAARRENETLRARRKALWSVLAAILIGLAATLNFAWDARRAEREATQAAKSAQSVTAFLSEDLLGAIDPSTRKGREVDLISVLDAGAAKIDGRFADDIGGKEQAYVALMEAYENFPVRPLEELLPLWKKHYQALMDWMAADPESAFPVAYKVIQDQPDLAYLRDQEKLVIQLKDYAQKTPGISTPVRLNIALLEAALLTQDGRWRSAVAAYEKTEGEVFEHFDEMLKGNSWSLSTFVRDNGSLQRLATAQKGCRMLLDYEARHAAELPLEERLDYAFACTAEATYSGDFARLLALASDGAARARPIYAEEDGYMQTFYGWQGMALTGLGRYAEARPIIDRAIQLREKTRSGVYLAGTYTQRGWFHERQGNWQAALADYQKASAALSGFRNNPRIITAQAGLARSYARLGQAAEAEAALAVIPQAVLEEVPPHYRSVAGKRRAEGLILRLRGDEAGAQAAFQEAEGWLAADFGPDHVWTREARDERMAVR